MHTPLPTHLNTPSYFKTSVARAGEFFPGGCAHGS
jgi:hypothetical protein